MNISRTAYKVHSWILSCENMVQLDLCYSIIETFIVKSFEGKETREDIQEYKNILIDTIKEKEASMITGVLVTGESSLMMVEGITTQ